MCQSILNKSPNSQQVTFKMQQNIWREINHKQMQMQLYKSSKLILLLGNWFRKLLKVVSWFEYISTNIYRFYGWEHAPKFTILSTRLWVRLHKLFDQANNIKIIRFRIR